MVKRITILLLCSAYTVLFFTEDIAATYFFVVIYAATAVAWIYRGHLSLPLLSVVHAVAGCYLAFVGSLAILYESPFSYYREWQAIFGVLVGALGFVGTRNYWFTLLIWTPFILVVHYTLAFVFPVGTWAGEGDLWRFATLLFVLGLWQILKSDFDRRRYIAPEVSKA